MFSTAITLNTSATPICIGTNQLKIGLGKDVAAIDHPVVSSFLEIPMAFI